MKLCETPVRLEFDLNTKTDSLSGYNPLRDPALVDFLTKPTTLRRLVRLGLVTRDGRVVTSYKQVNDYCNNYLQGLKATLARKKVSVGFRTFGASQISDLELQVRTPHGFVLSSGRWRMMNWNETRLQNNANNTSSRCCVKSIVREPTDIKFSSRKRDWKPREPDATICRFLGSQQFSHN